MSETAEERKKRLHALREDAQNHAKELKFRNYLPHDEELQAGQVRGLSAQHVSPERRVRSQLIADRPTPSLTVPTRLRSTQIKARVAPEIDVPVAEPDAPGAEDEDAVVNVMPAKANADLKRDVERKLEKLERKTQRAMIELTREEDARRMAERQNE